MPRQKTAELLLKRHRSMMVLLVFNIPTNRGRVRRAHRKCAVPILPAELDEVTALGLEPLRRTRLDLLDQVAQRVVF